jgi:HK97 family phage prohead protease
MRALLRGVAIPYARTRLIGDVVEMVEPGAFGKMLAGSRRTIVRSGGHDVSDPLIGIAELFEGDEGLYFSVSVALGCLGVAAALEASVNDGEVSVGFASMQSRREMRDGMRTRVIFAAALDHIALVGKGGAAYGDGLTRYWRADADARLVDAPWHVREADRRWRKARAEAATRTRVLSPAEDRERIQNAWRNIMSGRAI